MKHRDGPFGNDDRIAPLFRLAFQGPGCRSFHNRRNAGRPNRTSGADRPVAQAMGQEEQAADGREWPPSRHQNSLLTATMAKPRKRRGELQPPKHGLPATFEVLAGEEVRGRE